MYNGADSVHNVGSAPRWNWLEPPLNIFIQASMNDGVAVAKCGKMKASTKLKPMMTTIHRLNRTNPTRPSQPAFTACLT